MLTKVGLRTMVIDLRTIAITLFIWAVTTVAAQNIEIVVHRGANALAPENTWPSAEAALQYGAKWIEVDVRKSKDGELFNLHDETLDRTTNGKALIAISGCMLGVYVVHPLFIKASYGLGFTPVDPNPLITSPIMAVIFFTLSLGVVFVSRQIPGLKKIL